MLMKTPGFEWEPDPPKRTKSPLPRLVTVVACTGIGLSILVLYSATIILIIERTVRPIGDHIVTTIAR